MTADRELLRERTKREQRYFDRLVDRSNLLARRLAATALRESQELLQEKHALDWAIAALAVQPNAAPQPPTAKSDQTKAAGQAGAVNESNSQTDKHIPAPAAPAATKQLIDIGYAALKEQLRAAQERIKYHEQERENLILAATNAQDELSALKQRLEAERGSIIEKWFNKGRDSVLRENVSGCCCKIDEDGETILSPCDAHRAWAERDAAREKAIEESAQAVESLPDTALATFASNRWNAVKLTKYLADKVIRALKAARDPERKEQT